MTITHPVLLIRPSRLFREGMSDEELYEVTRGVWKLGRRREAVEYVLTVIGGVVREVYRVDGWHPAGSTAYATRPQAKLRREGRWEFTGDVAPAEVRRLYLGAAVGEYFPQGMLTPFRNVNA